MLPVIVGLVCSAVIVLLALLGPAIGSVFSNIVRGLSANGGTENNRFDETATAIAATNNTIIFNIERTEAAAATLPPHQTPSGAELTATRLSTTQSENQPSPTFMAIGVIPTPTATPDTDAGIEPDETPFVIIASANVLVRSADSGGIIGNGTVRVFAPASVQYPATARIELELAVDNVYITPTPFGAVTTFPRATSTPRPGLPTPTPREPIFGESGISVYQRTGAALRCAEASFSGCDTGYPVENLKLIAENLTTWSWIITPREGIHGLQDVQVELWAVRANADGTFDHVDIWSYGFQLSTDAPGGISPALAIVAGVGGVLVIAGVVVVQRRAGRSARQKVLTEKPLVFISYRRGASWAQARSIANSIRERGINVFIDVDNIDEGRFAEIIEKAILDCQYFVPVLSPTTLESPWVVKEIISAIQHKRRIIPVLTDGFDFYRTKLPEEIQEIASHNAITITPEFYEEAIDRLVKRFIKYDE